MRRCQVLLKVKSLWLTENKDRLQRLCLHAGPHHVGADVLRQRWRHHGCQLFKHEVPRDSNSYQALLCRVRGRLARPETPTKVKSHSGRWTSNPALVGADSVDHLLLDDLLSTPTKASRRRLREQDRHFAEIGKCVVENVKCMRPSMKRNELIAVSSVVGQAVCKVLPPPS